MEQMFLMVETSLFIALDKEKTRMEKVFQDLLMDMLKEVRDGQKTSEAQLATAMQSLASHTKIDEENFRSIMKAFPNGEIDGHRRYHQSIIDWYELRNRVIRECLVHILKAGAIGALVWVGWTLLVAVKLWFIKFFMT